MGQVSSRISNIFNEKQKKLAESPTNECSSKNNSLFLQQVKNFDIADKEHISENCGIPNIKEKTFNSSIFATPRLPLKRSREISPIISVLPQSILDIISPCSKRLKIEEEYLDFPFITDCQTVDYLKKCKLMFILRGAPGSGKSTITKSLRRIYTSFIICSADDFFMDGLDYLYDGKKIGEAHAFCKQKAVNAALAQSRTIIIDNTNIKCWEMKFYIDLANTFNYFSIVVEPKTPWRRDISILVKKNTHNVDEESLSIKIKNFEELNPLFYGWFINEADSYLLTIEGQSWLEEAFTIDVFQTNLALYSGVNNFEDFVKRYCQPKSTLHVTSKYTAKKLPEDKVYMEKDHVKNSIGKAFDLEIIGFIITPRTFGARVKLTGAQEILWAGDDYENIPDHFWNVSTQENEINTLNMNIANNYQELEVDNDELKPNDENNSNVLEYKVNHNNSPKNENKQLSLNKTFENQQTSFDIETKISKCNYFNDFNAQNNHIENIEKAQVADSITDLHETKNSTRPTSSDEDVSTELNCKEKLNESVFANVENSDQGIIGDYIITVNEEDNHMLKPKSSKEKIHTKIKPNKISPLQAISTPKKSEFHSSEKKCFQNKCSPNKNRSPKKRDVLIPENKVKPEHSITEATIEEKSIEIFKNKFNPTSGCGSRAHVTLGCQSNVKPVTTGLDLLFAIELENNVVNKMEKNLSELNTSMSDLIVEDVTNTVLSDKETCIGGTIKHTLSLNGATAKNYGYGVWIIYLEKKLVVSSLFNMKC